MDQDYVTSNQMMQAMTAEIAAWARRGLRLPAYRQPLWEMKPHPGADPVFVARVTAAWRALDLTIAAVVSEDAILTLRAARYHGLPKVIGRCLFPRFAMADDDTQAAVIRSALYNMGTLGGDILVRLLGEEGPSWFPWHYAWIGYSMRAPRETFILRPASLRPVQTSTEGVVWGSPTRPTATVGRRTAPLVFSPHAVARITERLTVTDTPEYAGWGDIFSYLQRSRYFEPARLHPDQPAISLFDIAVPGTLSWEIAESLLDNIAPDTFPHPAYRLGSCPVVFDAGCWVATTFLPPGFTGTPEYGKALATSLDPLEKAALLDACATISLKAQAHPEAQALRVWFHRHGVPQAIRTPRELYDPLDLY